MSIISKIILLLSIVSMPLSAAVAPDKEVSSERRSAVVSQMLKKEPSSLLVYTKGLVCKSCGIGIRKHIAKMRSVDRSRGKKGVLLDINNQLVQVMVYGEPDTKAVAKAIRDAGYTPVKAYYKLRGRLVVKPL